MSVRVPVSGVPTSGVPVSGVPTLGVPATAVTMAMVVAVSGIIAQQSTLVICEIGIGARIGLAVAR